MGKDKEIIYEGADTNVKISYSDRGMKLWIDQNNNKKFGDKGDWEIEIFPSPALGGYRLAGNAYCGSSGRQISGLVTDLQHQILSITDKVEGGTMSEADAVVQLTNLVSPSCGTRER